MVTKMEALLMDHNLLGLAIPFFPKVVRDPFDKSPKKIFPQVLPLSSPCSSPRTQGSTWPSILAGRRPSAARGTTNFVEELFLSLMMWTMRKKTMTSDIISLQTSLQILFKASINLFLYSSSMNQFYPALFIVFSSKVSASRWFDLWPLHLCLSLI